MLIFGEVSLGLGIGDSKFPWLGAMFLQGDEKRVLSLRVKLIFCLLPGEA